MDSVASTCSYVAKEWVVNIKRVVRIYRAEGLAIRTKTPRRRRAPMVREMIVQPTAPNQSWAMNLMHDILANGTKIRLLTIVDTFSREKCGFGGRLRLQIGASGRRSTSRGYAMRSAGAHLLRQRPRSRLIALGSMGVLDARKARLLAPRTPSDNAFCESFNNRVRQELLNLNWFRSLDDAWMQAAAWRIDYNTNHPHSSLGDLTPEEFAKRTTNRTLPAAISGAPAD